MSFFGFAAIIEKRDAKYWLQRLKK